MALITNDLGSNLEENLERWAKLLRHEGRNKRVFEAIYSSSKTNWSTFEIAEKTGLSRKFASEGARVLYDKGLLTREQGNELRYSKRSDVYREKRKLLSLAGSAKKLAALPTKRKVLVSQKAVQKMKYLTGRAIHVSIDDIDSFARVKKIDRDSVPAVLEPPRLSEDVFKKGLENILGERTKLKDWGGENLDLYSTNLVMRGRRMSVGIALKGPAKTGSLTPGKMGANGDQIDRLFSQPLSLAIVQYEGDIATSVTSLMEKLARDKARSEDKNIYFCQINLLDSYRLRLAYKKQFALAAQANK